MNPNVIFQNFLMYMLQQQNPMLINTGINPGMMPMNPGMMTMNPGTMPMNPGMMPMIPQMFNLNNADINYMKEIFRSMGYSENMINNFFNTFVRKKEKPKNNSGSINLYFKHKTTQIKTIILTSYNESIASVVNKYITKSHDYHVNLYINNGKKLNESLTVAESGLLDYSIIDVVAIDELEGALFY